ncbi:MAG: CoA transferase [Proteobacteria bacterium]|nr:CoA transferase [Pseudomonadota bacterium]
MLVDNLGTSVARNVLLTDLTLSNGDFTIVSVATSQGDCDPSPPPLPLDVSGFAIISCDLGDLDPKSPSVLGRATVTIEITAQDAQAINNIADVYADPQVQAREMMVEMEHPQAGRVRNIGIPVKLSETPGSIRRPAPTLGQHTDEVLAEFGYSSDEIAKLKDSGAVA